MLGHKITSKYDILFHRHTSSINSITNKYDIQLREKRDTETHVGTYNCFSCWFTETMLGAGMAALEGLHHIKFFILLCVGFCIVPVLLLFHRESIITKFCESYDTKVNLMYRKIYLHMHISVPHSCENR